MIAFSTTSKTILLQGQHNLAVQFLCGLCRQIRNTSSLMSEIEASHQSEDFELIEGLLEHLYAVNGAEGVPNDPEAAFDWAHSLVCRAYALNISSR